MGYKRLVIVCRRSLLRNSATNDKTIMMATFFSADAATTVRYSLCRLNAGPGGENPDEPADCLYGL